MSFAVREAVWLRLLYSNVVDQMEKFEHTVIFADNEGALNFVKNDVINDRSKHIAIKYFFHVRKSRTAVLCLTTFLQVRTHRK